MLSDDRVQAVDHLDNLCEGSDSRKPPLRPCGLAQCVLDWIDFEPEPEREGVVEN